MTPARSEPKLTRVEALRCTVLAYPVEPYVVAVGTMIREMLLVGRADNHLYVLDSMGLPPAIGLGISLGLAEGADEKVLVIEGDGGMLMGLSTLATIGLLKPRSLIIMVLDNGVYGTTGDQPTAASAVDFCAVARSCGFVMAWSVADEQGLQAALAASKKVEGPTLLHVRITKENASTPYYAPDPVELRLAFERCLSSK